MSPNKNYIAGRAFEYSLKKDYEAMSYIVVRASGSHGPFDLIALHPSGQVLLIQCKILQDISYLPTLLKNWRAEDPPLPASEFEQMLAVKIKGSKDVRNFLRK